MLLRNTEKADDWVSQPVMVSQFMGRSIHPITCFCHSIAKRCIPPTNAPSYLILRIHLRIPQTRDISCDSSFDFLLALLLLFYFFCLFSNTDHVAWSFPFGKDFSLIVDDVTARVKGEHTPSPPLLKTCLCLFRNVRVFV